MNFKGWCVQTGNILYCTVFRLFSPFAVPVCSPHLIATAEAGSFVVQATVLCSIHSDNDVSFPLHEYLNRV